MANLNPKNFIRKTLLAVFWALTCICLSPTVGASEVVTYVKPTYAAVKVESIDPYAAWLAKAFGLQRFKVIDLPDDAGQILIMRKEALVVELLI